MMDLNRYLVLSVSREPLPAPMLDLLAELHWGI